MPMKSTKILLVLIIVAAFLPHLASAAFDPYSWTEDECKKTLTAPESNEGFGLSVTEFEGNKTWYYDSSSKNCFAPSPKPDLKVPIPNITSDRVGIPEYVGAAFKYAISIAGILAAVMIMVGGAMWVVSAGDSGRITTAKQYITSSVIGLVLLFCTYILLNTINPALVNLTPLKVKIAKNIQLSSMYCPTSSTVYSKDTGAEVKGSETQCGTNYLVQKNGDATCQGQSCKGSLAGSYCLPNANDPVGKDPDTGKPKSACLSPKIACEDVTSKTISKWGVSAGQTACEPINAAMGEQNIDGSCAWIDKSWLGTLEAGAVGGVAGLPGIVAGMITKLKANPDSCIFCSNYKSFKTIMDVGDPKKESCRGIFNTSVDLISGAFIDYESMACFKAWCSDSSATITIVANGCSSEYPYCVEGQCAMLQKEDIDCKDDAPSCNAPQACGWGKACVDKKCCEINNIKHPQGLMDCSLK